MTGSERERREIDETEGRREGQEEILAKLSL